MTQTLIFFEIKLSSSTKKLENFLPQISNVLPKQF
jgi:hypothetical protein